MTAHGFTGDRPTTSTRATRTISSSRSHGSSQGTPWSAKTMAMCELECRALVTLIDGHLAIVLPHSVANVSSDADMVANLIKRVSDAIAEALEDGQ